MSDNKEPTLKKELSQAHVWAIAFGCIIGWGSFINPGKKFLPNSGVAGTAIAMVLGALVMIILAYSYAYMVPKYPKAGAVFFARPFWRKLQNIFGECCISKMEKVAKLPEGRLKPSGSIADIV